MGLLTKIIKTFGEPTEIHKDTFGDKNLYPEGTKRLVKKFFLFPQKIDGTKVEGSWIVEQIAGVGYYGGGDGVVRYTNSWKSTKAIEKYDSSPEKKYKHYIENYLN